MGPIRCRASSGNQERPINTYGLLNAGAVMKRIFVLLATLALPAAAAAQSTQFQVGSQPALEVQRLAPQLVAFAGGEVNFTNLVNGLAFGVPVTLTSATTPGGTLSTALGTTPVTGAVTTTAGLATSTQPSVSPAVAQQNAISSAVAGSTARRNMSDSVFPRGISDTLPTPAPTPAPSIPTTAPAAPAAGSAGGTPIPAASVPSTATPPALTPLRR